MGGLGSSPAIEIIELEAVTGTEKTIGKDETDDLVVPSMIKRVRIRGQGSSDAWHYAFAAGEAKAGKFMNMRSGEGIDWNGISEFPKLYVISADAGTPKLAVEMWQ